MKDFRNEIFTIVAREDLIDLINNLYHLFKRSPFLLKVHKGGAIKEIENLREFSSPPFLERKPVYCENNFFLIPTVKKTSLFYSMEFDCFIKIIHPLSIKDRLLFLCSNRGQKIYNLSIRLNRNNIRVPEVIAYGYINHSKKPLFIMNRLKGESMYPVMIGKKISHLIYTTGL